MSNSGVGGEVSSAVARALGSGRQADADRLVLHTLVLAVSCEILFILGVLSGELTLWALSSRRSRYRVYSWGHLTW